MPTANAQTAVVPTDPKELGKLLQRAEGGDETTLPVLRELLKAPRIVEDWGNLAAHAAQSFVNKAAGKNLAFREGLLRKLELLRGELAGPSPTPLECLLVERVVACWLQVQDADIRYAQDRPNLSLNWSKYYQQRMDRAHKRYLSAIKALALVRKLALPVLQVNIAKTQVNVAGGVPGPAA